MANLKQKFKTEIDFTKKNLKRLLQYEFAAIKGNEIVEVADTFEELKQKVDVFSNQYYIFIRRFFIKKARI